LALSPTSMRHLFDIFRSSALPAVNPAAAMRTATTRLLANLRCFTCWILLVWRRVHIRANALPVVGLPAGNGQES